MTRDRYPPDFTIVVLKLKEKRSFLFVHYKMYERVTVDGGALTMPEIYGEIWLLTPAGTELRVSTWRGDWRRDWDMSDSWPMAEQEQWVPSWSWDNCQSELRLSSVHSQQQHVETCLSLSVSVTQSVRQSVRLIKLLIKIGKTSYSNGRDTSSESCFVTDNS